MNFKELKDKAGHFTPIFILEKTLPHRIRKRAARIFSILVFFFAALVFIPYGSEYIPEHSLFSFPNTVIAFFGGEKIFLAILFLVLPARAILFLLESFFYSEYFRALSALEDTKKTHISFEVAMLVLGTDSADILKGFSKNFYGGLVLARSGVSKEDTRKFLERRRPVADENGFKIDATANVTLSVFAQALWRSDENFARYMLSRGVLEKDFLGAAEWVEKENRMMHERSRWWGREQLDRLPSLGRDWSYGETYLLKRYGHEISEDPVYRTVSLNFMHGEKGTLMVEKILASAAGANAFLVGEERGEAMEVMARLGKMIETGKVFPELEHKHIFIFHGEALLAEKKTKGDFEAELIRVFDQATRAGNVILVIPDFPGFLESAHMLGCDIENILGTFLSSQKLHVIATSDPRQFHKIIEPRPTLVRQFVTVFIESASAAELLFMLQDAVSKIESRDGVFFTFPAVKEILESADRYIAIGILEEKALQLLYEFAASIKGRAFRVVGKEDVLQFVKTKTGIPMGEVAGEEKEKLIHLEEALHKRVVGQDKAVSALSGAMRRARLKIQSERRPIGSFLFLGPTGVGKTETAKALAEIFFGSDERMLRLDMSEYKTADSLQRLIGSYTLGRPGALASLLRERPYGVLLLDEFEKADKNILDLFLQILDEGKFKDAEGYEVNARNCIIIATSNAGSDLIFKWAEEGEDVMRRERELIGEIVARGIYKAELLNRFDGVIVFHPLEKEHLSRIAELMLRKLGERLKEKGLELVINEPVIAMLLKVGYDPQFGARPMNRAIQERVEKVIAEKILRGELKPGMRVEFTADELV